ncbi:gliding motility-associated C-terminal domain-containing protein [Solitalea sp. MAHUQ-68]|uniref:Gliding motility-associated C-terminal domain-containing protein n=1 Tax=Solitalea agri TaxID=2953739 RepID=A0A9X2JBN9_9SPHI|nr:Calx-beta domain-containing protein [Solitalea agri]MCO4292163.1 gliding motility-associated C-terminal domain-containing protein [Solitalea agri]
MKDSTNVSMNEQFKGLTHSLTKVLEIFLGTNNFHFTTRLFSLFFLLFVFSSADDYDGNQTVKPQKGLTIISTQSSPPCIKIQNSSCKEANTGYSTTDFKVILDAPCKEEITVEYYTRNGTAGSTDDYKAASGKLTFAPGEESKNITISLKGDFNDEEDEYFYVYLKNPKNATLCDDKATGTIIDNDPFPTLKGEDKRVFEKNEGVTNYEYFFAFKDCSQKETRFDYSTYDGTATAGEDYIETKGTLIIPAGQSKFKIEIPVYGDTKLEPDETFFVKLSNPDGLILKDDVFQITILNDDSEGGLPAISINNSAVNEGDGTASFTVALNKASTEAITVDYATANSSAKDGSDYTGGSGTLTFAPGETSKTIDIAILEDTEEEADETFFVHLSNVSNATLTNDQGVGTIIDNDKTVELPTMSINNVIVNEADGTASFTVALNKASATDVVTVDYATANSSATDGSDYTGGSGTLTFAPGEMSKTIDIAILDDTEDEVDETFFVNLSNISNATFTNDQGVGTIVDNDEAPSAISISNVTVTEGNQGTVDAVFTVTLDKAASGTVTVNWATQDNTAVSPVDYTTGNGTLTFATGEISKTITVTIKGDETVENDETFLVNLSNATGGATIADDQGVGTITTDDVTLPAFRIDDVTVTEGNSGTVDAIFTISLSKAAEGTITVDWATQDNGAISPSDYTSGSGTLTFAAGETSKTVTVVVNGDETVEGNESFLVNLSNATSGATIADGQGIGQISNDDETLPALTINNVIVAEGNAGTVNAEFTVKMDKAAEGTITVDWATQDNSAISPSDYTSGNGTLSFAAGETSKTITIEVNGDVTVESDEVFHVNLSNVSAGATISDGQGAGTITNDDEAPPSLSIDDVSVTEGNSGTSTATLTVTMNKVAAEAVTVKWATQDNGAVSPADYASGNGTLTFAAGETSKTIDLTINGDVTVEGNEGFLVNLTGPTGGAVIGDSQGTVTITNDDETLPALSIDNVEVTEGNSGTVNAVFTVKMDKEAAETVTVDWATQDEGAVSPSDYTSGNGTLTFAAGETTKTITVVVKGDATNESNESFLVNLTNVSSGATIADGQGFGNILNDDEPLPSLSMKAIEVNEGNSGTVDAVFTVTLDKAGASSITVDYQTVENSATDPEDYTAVNGTLTFAAGETSKTVTVKVKGDVDVEGNHGFYLQLLNPSTNAQIGTENAYCTIVDDDQSIPAVRIYDTYVYEGNTGSNDVTFYVYLNKNPSETVTVDFATEDVTAIAGEDYVAASGTLTFNPGETYKTFTVAVNGDTDFEGNEQFRINLTNPTNATLEDGVGNFIIYNDDNAIFAFVYDGYFSPEEDEGTSTKTFYIYLSDNPSKPVTLDYTLADGTAKAGEDYVTQSGSLTFNTNEYFKAIDIVCNGDNNFEGDEFFRLVISNIQNALITDGEAIVTIYDDDAPIQFYSTDAVANPEGNDGTTTTATFYVYQSDYSDQTNSVDYATANGNASSGSDYVAANGTLTFNPGELYKQVDITVNGDNTLESDEVFKLQLSNPVNGSLRDAFGIGIIYDDDAPPYFYVTSATADEGQNEVFYVYRSVSTGTATVNYATINQNAVAPDDYTATSGTVTFNAGEYFKMIEVPTIADGVDEPYEYFTMRLSSPSSGYLIYDQDGYGQINGSAYDYNYLTVAGTSDYEGDSGTKTLTVYVSLARSGNNNAVTVNYALQNVTATSGSDYVASSGSFTFAADEFFKQIDITVNGDNTFEIDEQLRVVISSATNAVIWDPSALVTISNDDTPALIYVNDVAITEGDSGNDKTATVGVYLSPPNADQSVTVSYTTVAGSATAGTDFTAASGILTFDPGNSFQTFDVNIVGDNTFEPVEYFRVLLSSPGNATIADGDGYVQITDNDQMPYLYVTDPFVTEGDSGDPILYFYVYLNSTTDKVVTVDYTTQDLTATSEDYTAVNGTLTFDGITGQYVEVHVNPDVVFEPNEYLKFALSNPVNANIGDGEGSGLITDDDNTPIISVYDTYVYEGNSGETDMYFGVWLNQWSDQTITVDFATSNGTATAGSDYTAATGTLTFSPYTTYQYVNIKITGDVVDEADETFKVTISNPTNVLIGDNEATGTIYDDDAGSGFARTSARISNVFTPNGDGVNDLFKIEGVENSENDLTVVNRYGSQIFRSTNYKNDWDGQGCSDGTYFYLLKTKDKDGKVEVKKGYITLIRNLNR